jgi:hypothetical protein
VHILGSDINAIYLVFIWHINDKEVLTLSEKSERILNIDWTLSEKSEQSLDILTKYHVIFHLLITF